MALLEAGTYLGESIVDLDAQEGENKDNYDSDEYQNEGILYQTLAFLLQLLDLVTHLLPLKHEIKHESE